MSKSNIGVAIPVLGKIIVNFVNCPECGHTTRGIEVNLIQPNSRCIELEQTKVECGKCGVTYVVGNNTEINLNDFELWPLSQNT